MPGETHTVRESGRSDGILSLWIRDRRVLRAAYMPFLAHGGLFVPTDRQFRLGDEVFLLLRLLDEPERIPVAGKVAWVTPQGAQGQRVPGAGVQFGIESGFAREKIENYLADAPATDYRTHTM
ncbi:MAG: PilZ domain-containing protein [Gammaproteobacteria bacterium]|nr:PilZ domain-containing protein [Gammaproteobacteria bacterium]